MRPPVTGSALRGRGVTMRDVARLAGVSVGTVSNVLNEPTRVVDETRARVEQAIEALGYVRNFSARQLRSGSSRVVGLVVFSLDTFLADLARGVEDVANENGCVVILCNSGGRLDRQDEYLQVLAEHRAQGVILSPVQERSRVLDKLRGTSIPLVGLVGGGGAPFDLGVAGDFVHDAEIATEHLLELGHRRIAVVNGPPELEACIARSIGVERAVTRAGLDPAEALVRISTGTFEISAGEASLPQVLAAEPRPTAVFAVTDVLAVGVMHAALRAGLAVPGNLAVVGVGDMSMGATAAVPLTTVHYPAYEMGRSAATLLFDPPDTPRVVRFTPELVARASTLG